MNNSIRKINRVLIIVITILVIIIVLLLFKGCTKNNEENLHEGKVSIFEIKCDVDCKCTCEQQDDKSKENNKSNNTENKNSNISSDNTSNDDTQEVIKPINDDTEIDIKVFDSDKIWKDTEYISIFEDSFYVVKGKIAPESTGTYQFIVKNSTKYNVDYDIDFDETNNKGINMKYKLKKNNEYIISEWVTYSQLKQTDIRLNVNSNDTYFLEWKWFGTSDDNSIGEDGNSKYGISINIMAVQTND